MCVCSMEMAAAAASSSQFFVPLAKRARKEEISSDVKYDIALDMLGCANAKIVRLEAEIDQKKLIIADLECCITASRTNTKKKYEDKYNAELKEHIAQEKTTYKQLLKTAKSEMHKKCIEHINRKMNDKNAEIVALTKAREEERKSFQVLLDRQRHCIASLKRQLGGAHQSSSSTPSTPSTSSTSSTTHTPSSELPNCPICFDSINDTNAWILTCGHSLHVRCKQGLLSAATLTQRARCPCCRAEIR